MIRGLSVSLLASFVCLSDSWLNFRIRSYNGLEGQTKVGLNLG